MFGTIAGYFKRVNSDVYVFAVSLIFYTALWFLNPGNKIIALSSILLIIIHFLRFKRLDISLLLAFITYSVIFTGKSYPIQLLPSGIFPEEIFPNGYFIDLVVSPSHIISFFMLVFLIRNIYADRNLRSKLKVGLVDVLFLSLFFWGLISDGIFSRRPDVSLVNNLLGLGNLIAYFYLKIFKICKIKDFLPIIVGLFSAMVVFESLISFGQLMAKSPRYKNIEYQVNIEYFGKAVDESEFTFRPVGTFAHANFLGIWLSSVLIILTSVFLKRPTDYVLFAILLGLASLSATLSRSAWLGFGVGSGLVLFMLRKKDIRSLLKPYTKKLLIFIPITIVLVLFFVFPRLQKSLYSFGVDSGGGFFRRIQIKDSLEIIKENPLFGVGSLMGVYEGLNLDRETVLASIPLAVHNWYLQICLENGIPALTLFILMILFSFRPLINNIMKFGPRSFEDYAYTGFVGGVLSLLVAGIFQPYIGDTLMFLSLGLINSGIIGKEIIRQ